MKNFEIKMAAVPEIYIYGDIGDDFDGLTASEFAQALNGVKNARELSVRINSQGGDVFEAMGIYSALARHPAKVLVYIDGLAASAASYIAMVGDRIRVADNAIVMIHEPYGAARGTAETLMKRADMLRKVTGTVVDTYAKRSRNSTDDVMGMLVRETWMDAREAVEMGFADEITEGTRIAAHVDVGRFQKPPQRLLVTDGKVLDSYRQRLSEFRGHAKG